MRIRIYPYKQGSRSAFALANALGARVLKKENSGFVGKQGDVIINWGDSTCEGLNAGPQTLRLLNHPSQVLRAANKLQAFTALSQANVPIPAFARRREDVTWQGTTVVRHKLTGHSGEGIEIVEEDDDLPDAPLYVQYVPKQHEFRVHVIGKSIIAVQRKARDRENPNPNWQVRNHKNGFIFIREGFETPPAVLEQAPRATEALGLDFGAVDIIWNAKQQRAYVLEVNTAPGLEGRTIDDYANGFRNLLSSSS